MKTTNITTYVYCKFRNFKNSYVLLKYSSAAKNLGMRFVWSPDDLFSTYIMEFKTKP